MHEIILETCRLIASAFVGISSILVFTIMAVSWVAGLFGGAFLPLKYYDIYISGGRNLSWLEVIGAVAWVVFYFVFYISLMLEIIS
jgi:hypothetical protein